MKIVRPINDSTPNVSQAWSLKHRGTDYSYPQGTPVYAAQAGKVVAIVNKYDKNWINKGTLTTADYGNFIKIDHGDGYSTIYAHLKKDSMNVGLGQYVNRGEQLASSGNTGNSTGPHMHFEYRKQEVPINPYGDMNRDFAYYFDGR